MFGGGFPRGFMYDSDEEMEMEIEYLIRHAERYAGRAQPASSCSTGAYTTQQTDQATLSTEETSEQAVESVTTETEPSASQNGATAPVSSQLSGSSLSQLAPSVTTTEARQSQIAKDINVTLSDQLAVTTVTPSISSQTIDVSRSTNSQLLDASKSTSAQSTDASKASISRSVIVTDTADTGNSLPSISSVTVSDITDTRTETESQTSIPLATVRDIAGFKSDSQSSGSSPKRKASEGEDTAGQEEAGMVEGEPSRKEPRREEGGEPGEQEGEGGHPEEEDREDVDELVKMFNRYRRRPLSPNREQLFRQLPREIVREMMLEITYRDSYLGRGRRHRSRREEGPREPASDEESDEEGLRRSSRNRQEAKFPVTNRQMLLRLLILGGAIRAKARAPDPTTNQDFLVISNMIHMGEGPQVVEMLKDVSVRGRSSKQDGLLYGLAICCRSNDMDTKRAAYTAIQDMIRTPTQIFQLINYIEKAGRTTGWGRGLRRALCTWYNNYSTNPTRLAMHVTKYWSRHEWNHRDVIRLSHIKPVDNVIGFIIRYIAKDMQEAEKYYLEDGYLGNEQLEKVHKYLKAVEEAKRTMDVERTVELIREYGLVREQLRTEMLNEPAIWEAMLPSMPLTALTRNLGKMSLLGLFDNAERVQTVISKLSNVTAMKKARIHPFKLLLAHHIYKQGHGDQGKLTWTPNAEILAALESAFYRSFEAVEPSNKRILIALDISGSMASKLLDSPIEVREAATLMAMLTFRREPHCDIVGFHHRLIPLEMFKDPNKTLDQLVQETHNLGFGTTDCAKPMIWARKHHKEYDAFIIYTDSETNMHRIPPYVALEKYREVMNIPTAKLIVVGMSSAYDFSISRPDDMHMLDVVGFDPDTPEMISEFLVGGLE